MLGTYSTVYVSHPAVTAIKMKRSATRTGHDGTLGSTVIPPPDGLPPVLHADERLLVFDKPSGLLSVPGIGPEKADCLVARAEVEYPGARIVHRLDRDTSGVIVARMPSPPATFCGSRTPHQQAVSRVGVKVPEAASGVIDFPMRKDMCRPPRQVIDWRAGRAATTRWSLLEAGDEAALLSLEPVTGRTHQLRLHLAVSGHPILGDDLYATGTAREDDRSCCTRRS